MKSDVVTFVNVAIGAMLGAVIADSPILKLSEMEFGRAVFFLTLVVAFAANIALIVKAVELDNGALAVIYGVIFVFMEIVVLFSQVISGAATFSSNKTFDFSGSIDAWILQFILITVFWTISNTGAALLEKHGLKP